MPVSRELQRERREDAKKLKKDTLMETLTPEQRQDASDREMLSSDFINVYLYEIEEVKLADIRIKEVDKAIEQLSPEAYEVRLQKLEYERKVLIPNEGISLI